MLGSLLPGILYIIVGVIAILGNVLTIGAVLGRRHLRGRKEMLLVVILCCGCTVLGFGYFILGAYRVNDASQPVQTMSLTKTEVPNAYQHLQESEKNDTLYANATGVLFATLKQVQCTAWDCMLLASTPFFLYGSHTVIATLLFISIDRFLAIQQPIFYLGLRCGYVIRAGAAIYGLYGPIILVLAYWSSFTKSRQGNHYSCVCLGIWAMGRSFYLAHISVLTALSLASCLLYAALMIVIRGRKSPTAANSRSSSSRPSLTTTYSIETFQTDKHPKNDSKPENRENNYRGEKRRPTDAQRRQVARQDAVTRLLSSVILLTLACYCLPYCAFLLVMLLVHSELSPYVLYGTYVNWVLAAVYCIVTVLLYSWKHEDIRTSLCAFISSGLRLFCCRRNKQNQSTDNLLLHQVVH